MKCTNIGRESGIEGLNFHSASAPKFLFFCFSVQVEEDEERTGYLCQITYFPGFGFFFLHQIGHHVFYFYNLLPKILQLHQFRRGSAHIRF